MKYSESRNIAKDGDLLFLYVKKDSFLSRLVAFFTRSKFTHVGFLFWYNSRLLIVESTSKGGLQISNASIYEQREVELIPAPKSWKLIEDRALDRTGTAKYGWFSAFYIGLREVLFTHFNIRLPQDRHNRNKACSEFVSEILEFKDVDISPGVLYKIFTEKDKTVL